MPGKFIVGRYLDLPVAGFQNNPTLLNVPDAPEHFAAVPNIQYEILQSTGVFQKRSTVSAGTNLKTHRNFRWLPWIPGAVSFVTLAGEDILTGPFTGCWVAIFDLAGTRYVGHIGTDLSPDHPNSIQVKEAWAKAVRSGVVTPHSAFNPVSGIGLQYAGAPTFYALITSNADMYNVVLTKPMAGGGNPLKQKIEVVSLALPVNAPPF